MAARFWVGLPVTGAANNGAGLIRLSVGVSPGTSSWSTGDVVNVNGVTGTTEANGTWTITVISGTTLDLQGSAFVNAWVSGGNIHNKWNGTNTANWALTTGATGGQAAPTSADSVTFDANSGAGTVTVSLGGSATFLSITCGVMASLTLDFSVNNDNITLTAAAGFNGSGAGALRAVTLGSNTITTPVWNFATTTGLTLTVGTSLIVVSGTSSIAALFSGGSKTYNTVTVTQGRTGGGVGSIAGQNGFANLTIGGGIVAVSSGSTLTISGSLTIGGSSATPCIFYSNGSVSTIALGSATASISWCALGTLTFTASSTPSATNSFNCGGLTNITVTQPSGGGGGLLVNPGMNGGMV